MGRPALTGLLPRGTFARSVALLAGGTALGQALVMLTSPILTRLYSPADFGAFAVYTAILAMSTGVVSLRYEVAIPLPETDAEGADVAALCALLSFLAGVVAAGAVFFLGGRVEAWTATPALSRFLWLLPVSLFLAGISQMLDFWGTRMRMFPQMARAKLAENISMVGVQLGLGLTGIGPAGLVAGKLAGYITGGWMIVAQAWRHSGPALRQISPAGIRRAAVRYRRFPLLACGAYLLNSVGGQLAPLMLAGLYGQQVAGWFALSSRIVGVPMSVIGQAIQPVYAGEIARLAHEEPGAMWRLFLRTAGRLLLIGSPPILVLGFAGPWLFGLVFGESWREAGGYTRLLILMVLTQFIAVPLSYTLDALERQDLQLAWDVGRLGLVFGALFLSRRAGVSGSMAVWLYGGAMTVGYVALFLVSALAIRQAAARDRDRRRAHEGSLTTGPRA